MLLKLLYLPLATALAVRAPPSQCDRTFLNDMTAAYLAAQALGEPWLIPSVATNLTYTEQFKPLSLSSGILSKPLNVTSHRSFYDDVRCTAFTQYIVMDPAHPYVIGTRFEADGLYITRIETLVTDQGDWAFNATGYKYWDNQENWNDIAQYSRDSREVIQAAGDAYFNRFANLNVSVPWGLRCARLEGGAYTGSRNSTGNTCDLGLPSSVEVVDRRYVVDQVTGTVVIYVGFPGLDQENLEPTPDSHMFRVEGGRIRYIHTLSTCEGHPGCGFNGTGPPSRTMSVNPRI